MKEEAVIRIEVKGKALSKANSYRISNSRMYKTKALKDWEKKISDAAKAAEGCPETPWSSFVSAEIDVYYPDRRRRDIDNSLKSILDALNNIIYVDDSQVTTLTVRKYYSKDDAKVRITIRKQSI